MFGQWEINFAFFQRIAETSAIPAHSLPDDSTSQGSSLLLEKPLNVISCPRGIQSRVET